MLIHAIIYTILLSLGSFKDSKKLIDLTHIEIEVLYEDWAMYDTTYFPSPKLMTETVSLLHCQTTWNDEVIYLYKDIINTLGTESKSHLLVISYKGSFNFSNGGDDSMEFFLNEGDVVKIPLSLNRNIHSFQASFINGLLSIEPLNSYDVGMGVRYVASYQVTEKYTKREKKVVEIITIKDSLTNLKVKENKYPCI